MSARRPHLLNDTPLQQLRLKGGRVVSSEDLSPDQIAVARAQGRLWVDTRGLGYAYLPPDAPRTWLPKGGT